MLSSVSPNYFCMKDKNKGREGGKNAINRHQPVPVTSGGGGGGGPGVGVKWKQEELKRSIFPLSAKRFHLNMSRHWQDTRSQGNQPNNKSRLEPSTQGGADRLQPDTPGGALDYFTCPSRITRPARRSIFQIPGTRKVIEQTFFPSQQNFYFFYCRSSQLATTPSFPLV